jgi:hypothetical protein
VLLAALVADKSDEQGDSRRIRQTIRHACRDEANLATQWLAEQ